MAKQVALLTCVTNGGGMGPGHTALVIDSTVYSFENAGDWFSIGNDKSGWKMFNIFIYLAKNEERPVVVQELKPMVVNADKVWSTVQRSINKDADYIGSGVCSSQAASAIEAGITGAFNPKGVDTPKKVYDLAKRKGIVSSSYYYWPGSEQLSESVRTRIESRLKGEYPEPHSDRPTIFAWT